jgi:phasin family protein
MSNSDQRKPGEKSGKRKQKRNKKAEEQQPPKAAPARAVRELIEAAIEANEPTTADAALASTALASANIGENAASVASADAHDDLADTHHAPPDDMPDAPADDIAQPMAQASKAPAEPAAPTGMARPAASTAAAPSTPARGIEALANAYRDYTRKSLADAQCFAEKLSAARSFDKAVEAQTEFAKKACETFVADSRKIRELYRELFWQTFRLPDWPLGRSR